MKKREMSLKLETMRFQACDDPAHCRSGLSLAQLLATMGTYEVQLAFKHVLMFPLGGIVKTGVSAYERVK